MSDAHLKVSPHELMERLPGTLLTGCYDVQMVPGKNILWCSTLQLVWDHLGDYLGGDPDLEKSTMTADSLNMHLVNADDIDDASHVAMAGIGGEKIVERIQTALTEKFGADVNTSLLPDPADVGPVDLLAYAFLFKSMEFATPFFNLDECDFITSEGYATSIKTFGYDPARNDGDQDLLQQITIHHYGSKDEFVIELQTKMAQDHLIFARIPPAATLEETVQYARYLLTDERDETMPFKADYPLTIPQLDFDITRVFNEFSGICLLNENFEEFVFQTVAQNIRFRLNREGALLKSEAAMFLLGSAAAKIEPPSFNLCAPHLILMLRDGAQHPYFALWQDNGELCLPADE